MKYATWHDKKHIRISFSVARRRKNHNRFAVLTCHLENHINPPTVYHTRRNANLQAVHAAQYYLVQCTTLRFAVYTYTYICIFYYDSEENMKK